MAWQFGSHVRETNGGSGLVRLLRSDKAVLIAITVVATVGRTISALYQGDAIAPLPGISDQISYDALARRLLAGYGFSFSTEWWPATHAGEPTAHWSFLYTLYLATVYALFGQHPLAARLIQAVVAGLLLPWFSYRIGSRLFGGRTGVVAAALSAVYPYFVYYGGALMTETFYILAILWSLDLATGSIRSWLERERALPRERIAAIGTKRPWVLLGLALGVAALLRQLILLFVPFLFAWILWTAISGTPIHSARATIDRLRHPIAGLLVSVLVLFAVIAPWTVRNYQAFGQFVLLNTNAGYAFFLSNHPAFGTDFGDITPSGNYMGMIPRELNHLNEAELEQALLRRGIGFVWEDPIRYALLSLSRVKTYFEFWPLASSSLASNLGRVLSIGISLPFMIYGLYLSAACRRRCLLDGQFSSALLLYLFVAVYSLIHILSWPAPRYRLPVDSILLIPAALAINDLTSQLAGRGRRPAQQDTLRGDGRIWPSL